MNEKYIKKPEGKAKLTIGETAHRRDAFLFILMSMLLLAGFFCNYYYIHISLPIRLIGWIILVIILLGFFSLTNLGRKLWKFFKEAKGEIRKVVWPTRQETFQTTLIVIVMVIILAVFLWLIDSLWMWLITMLTR